MATNSRIVETEQARSMLIRFIQNHDLPFVATITDGKGRTTKQNQLQRKWMQEISEQCGYTPEEARAMCKLTIGVPILREENEAFRIRYDEVVRPLGYETKLALMSEPLDMPVTRLMTTVQKKRYLDEIFRQYSERGIVLTIPKEGEIRCLDG